MRRPSVPAPLAALLVLTAILGVAWSVVVPAFQPPDEPDHISRIQRMVEGLPEPLIAGKKWSTQEETSVYGMDSLRLYGNTAYKPPWDPNVDAAIRAAEEGFGPAQRRDLNGRSVADDNPRGYYVVATLPFRLGGDFLSKLWAVRLLGVLILLVTVAGAWALIGELTGRNRLLQTAAAAAVGMQPMLDEITASVSPDGLMVATWTVSLWLAVRLMRRGLSVTGVLALVAAVGLSCWAKTPGFALVPAAVLAIGVAAFRRRWPDARPSPRRLVAGTAAAVAVLAGVYVALRSVAGAVAPQLVGTIQGVDSPRRFLSYVWQFYLPRPDFLDPTPGLGEDNRFMITWIRQAWGLFGNLDTPLPETVYRLLFAAGWLLLVLAVVALVRHRRQIDFAAVAVLALAVATLLLGLHITEYRVLTGGGVPFLQGRYILPAVGVGAVVVAAAVGALPRAWRPAFTGAVLAGAVAVQLVALYTVAVRFYAA